MHCQHLEDQDHTTDTYNYAYNANMTASIRMSTISALGAVRITILFFEGRLEHLSRLTIFYMQIIPYRGFTWKSGTDTCRERKKRWNVLGTSHTQL